ncbi:hypothetical protein A1F99_107000, partial [Pyrenophora tritici-repentis]
MAEVVIKTLQDFKIPLQLIGYFYCCNISSRTLLWGKGSAASFDNDVQELTDEHDFIEEWRR